MSNQRVLSQRVKSIESQVESQVKFLVESLAKSKVRVSTRSPFKVKQSHGMSNQRVSSQRDESKSFKSI